MIFACPTIFFQETRLSKIPCKNVLASLSAGQLYTMDPLAMQSVQASKVESTKIKGIQKNFCSLCETNFNIYIHINLDTDLDRYTSVFKFNIS